ncbi:hypothetical protein CEP54_014804 [Fusarium duplospermum]|uniref:Uncharacterized protein n=1 Tax=Fusarium duplospermum TaxID=1325734 RepID=A0A428NTS8_9HYPO|nr:hypothetical protein CEP54_014804 [Fusarium duplospermum]
MAVLIHPLTIVFLAFVGIAMVWQSTTTQIGFPMGKDEIHQMHVDRICHVYDVMRRISPGLTSPPNLYDYLGVRRGRDAETLGI